MWEEGGELGKSRVDERDGRRNSLKVPAEAGLIPVLFRKLKLGQRHLDNFLNSRLIAINKCFDDPRLAMIPKRRSIAMMLCDDALNFDRLNLGSTWENKIQD